MPLDQRPGIDGVCGVEKLDVGLVQDDRHVPGYAVEERLELASRSDCSGGVVRTAYDEQRSLRIHRLLQRREILPAVGIQWHGDRVQPDHLGHDRIAVEGWRSKDYAFLQKCECLHDLHGDSGRTGSDDDLIRVHPDMAGDQLRKSIRNEFRIPIRLGQCLIHRL